MVRERLLLLAVLTGALSAPARAIPAFARRYRTSCSTCHTAAPKLNALGEAFRLNGYRMPFNEQLLRREDILPLGAEPWKELWPRTIWPGDLPAAVPLSLRIQLDAYVARAGGVQPRSDFEFPHELYLLAGTTLGDGIGVFAEATLSPREGVEIAQAKVEFSHLVPFLPPRALNLWVGLQDLHPFTLAARQIDRAAKQLFRWQTFSPSDVVVSNAAQQTLQPLSTAALLTPQPALVAQGLIGRRIGYTAAVARGNAGAAADNNDHKDLGYTVRWKIGGLGLDGTYDTGQGPGISGHGQLLDHALVLEQFGYWGAEPAAGAMADPWHAVGVAARLYLGRLDLGAGYVVRQDGRPFGADAAGAMRSRSVFGKAEYAVLPWLFGSLKAERFDVDVPGGVRTLGYTNGRFGETRVMPGVYALLRQNMRAVIESEFYARHELSAGSSAPRPATVWFRLDLAF